VAVEDHAGLEALDRATLGVAEQAGRGTCQCLVAFLGDHRGEAGLDLDLHQQRCLVVAEITQTEQQRGEPGDIAQADLPGFRRDRVLHQAGPAAARRGRHHKAGPAADQERRLPNPQQPLYLGKAVHEGTAYPGEHDAIVTQRQWDTLHAILQLSPRVRVNQTRNTTAPLLRGLIFDSDGRAMSRRPSPTSWASATSPPLPRSACFGCPSRWSGCCCSSGCGWRGPGARSGIRGA
jgi:hypothetical protein